MLQGRICYTVWTCCLPTLGPRMVSWPSVVLVSLGRFAGAKKICLLRLNHLIDCLFWWFCLPTATECPYCLQGLRLSQNSKEQVPLVLQWELKEWVFSSSVLPSSTATVPPGQGFLAWSSTGHSSTRGGWSPISVGDWPQLLEGIQYRITLLP